MVQKCDVLIAGAGPVGLMLALMLTKQGVSCRIIDKMPTRQGYCKALGIQPRTLELWDDLGIINPIMQESLCFKRSTIFQEGKEIQSTHLELPELPFGFVSIPQFRLEDVLVEKVQELGLTIEQGIELVSFEQTDKEIIAVLKNNKTDTLESVQLPYLVGCDGAHSLVRKLLDIPFEGGKFPQTFMLADVRVTWDLEHPVTYRFNYKHDTFDNTVVFVPYLGDRRFRISTTVPESLLPEIKEGKPTLEQFMKVIEQAVPMDVEIDELRWSSMYQISHRIAQKYAEGRVFLAGDAAHIHPPIGGQGMNTGIQDAYNLAWKLALVLKNKANAHLLDTYHEERRPVGLDVVERTYKRMLSRNLGDSDAHYALLVNSQALINYRDSSLSKSQIVFKEEICMPGDRAPDASMLKQDIANFTVRLFEILRGHTFKLFLYADTSMDKRSLEDLLKTAETLRNRLGFLTEVYLIGSHDFLLSENSSLTLLSDMQSNFKTAYQAQGGNVFLIRPDNYIAYRGETCDEQAILKYLQDIGIFHH